MIAVAVLFSLALLARAQDVSDLLERLDLDGFDNTDSSSSDDSRIARAVEAALAAAEESSTEDVVRAAPEFSTLRLRLSTTNKAFQCGEFDCVNLNRASSVSDIEGVQATVTTSQGQTFTATFDAAGVADHVRDNFFFSVTYTNGGSGDDSFELTTPTTQFGVNVTSIVLSSPQGGEAGAAGLGYFDLESSTFFDEDTGLSADEELLGTIGTSVIGCDVDFDGVQEQGSTSFEVTVAAGNTADREFIVSNLTVAEGTTTFGGNLFVLADDTRVRDIGLGNLPCATRGRVIYDQIAIVTKRAGTTQNTADTLLHPLIYDELVRVSNANPVDLERFIFEMRVAAGRTQLRLRDITLDTGAFSDLSHKSKFTPCFRVFPDDDYQIEVFVGMRGGDEYVRGLLQDPNDGPNLVQDGQVVFDPENPPQFNVKELVLQDLVGDQTDTTRPFELLNSDVEIEVEECPEFSYFA